MTPTKHPIPYLSGLALCVALASCVTINIYFPAAAAEKAADQIIDEVWRQEHGSAAPAQKPAEK